MRFGLFYEHQLPRPWAQGDEERLLSNALEQIELADRLGLHSAWEVEHHFLEEYSHSSAPEVFLAAASQRTQQIRLGHGIVQLPPGFNHPARVAERVATLDLLSHGRVEFGTGESSSQSELGGFGVERDHKRAQWEESLDAIARMFVEEPFAGYHGRWIDMPPRNVIPKPKQKPHPPLWVACSRRETILVAARKGLGALSFSFIEPEQAKEWVDQYYGLIASDECVPGGFSVNPNLAVVLPFMVHPDEETAIERGIDGAHFFGYSLAHYYAFGEHRPGRTNVWEEFKQHRGEHGFARELIEAGSEQLGVNILQQGLGSLRGAVGTPAQVRELMERYAAAGVDQVIFVGQAGKNQHEHICESLELFAKEVLPDFAEAADDLEAAKRERLGEAMERALARREPARASDAGYVIQPGAEPSPARAPRPAAPTLELEPWERSSVGRLVDATGFERARAGVATRLRTAGETMFARLVAGKADDRVDRIVGSPAMLRRVFREMARQFRPERSGGLRGDIQYELTGRRGPQGFVIRVDEGAASSGPGRSPDPKLRITTTVPTFARMITGEVPPAKAWFEGRIQIEGDFQLAARLGEMFGRSSPW
jgi:alkanesulfonate monooxygenase SsuD/methylene tetrahydromethanopterin reductase-like flavin-dependent oxidoreductase (luciferase family)/putative sterol carrier protein